MASQEEQNNVRDKALRLITRAEAAASQSGEQHLWRLALIELEVFCAQRGIELLPDGHDKWGRIATSENFDEIFEVAAQAMELFGISRFDD